MGAGNGFYLRHGKRWLDALFALLGLAVTLPLAGVIALAIYLEDGAPPIFRQTRIGQAGKHFTMLKFRTLGTDAPRDVPTHLMRNMPAYYTRAGRFLRRTSLDEWPQLVNILRGEMSFVGPRPALWNQADLIALREQSGASRLRPGLTGLAQVSGRDELSIQEKARLDGVYARKVSLRMDCRCLARTVRVVLTREGYLDGNGCK